MSDVPDFRSLKQEAEMRRGGVVKSPAWSGRNGLVFRGQRGGGRRRAAKGISLTKENS